MKKIIVLMVMFFLVTGCSKNDPTNSLKEYLNNYQNYNIMVASMVNKYLKDHELTSNYLNEYQEIYEREYRSLTYEILGEEYNNNTVIIPTLINVYNLGDTEREVNLNYLNNPQDFQNNDQSLNYNKYMQYKLDKMLNTQTKIKYLINFKLILKNNKWIITELSPSDLAKINGNYLIS
jgi:hypothetical protein